MKHLFYATLIFAICATASFAEKTETPKQTAQEILLASTDPNCINDCAVEKSMCIAGCDFNNNQCKNRCSQAYGRCVARCNK